MKLPKDQKQKHLNKHQLSGVRFSAEMEFQIFHWLSWTDIHKETEIATINMKTVY